jgi:poly(A) polymerase
MDSALPAAAAPDAASSTAAPVSAPSAAPSSPSPTPSPATSAAVPAASAEPPAATRRGRGRRGALEPRTYPYPLPLDRIDPDAVKVIRRLTRAGHTAYLVGGGVRDLLLGRTPKDFDVATSARPAEVRNLFRNCRIIGRRFRLAHILFAGGKVIETATFRKDPTEALELAEREVQEELDALEAGEAEGLAPLPAAGRGKRRGVEEPDADLLIRHDNVFGEPHEDALRRDFTLNGLFYDVEREEVIDYVGGMADLERRVLRTIGAPEVRFREDPVRILRAIKFGARCDLGLAPEVFDALVDTRHTLSQASPPRVLEEILRLLRGGAAARSIWLAWDTGVLAVVLPELAAYLDDQGPDTDALFGRLRALDARVAAGRLPGDPVLLAALLAGPAEEAMAGARDPMRGYDEFISVPAERLTIPRRMRDRMRLVLLAQRRLRQGLASPARIAPLARREFFPDAATLLALALEADGKELPRWVSDAVDGPLAAAEPRGPSRAGAGRAAEPRAARGGDAGEPRAARSGAPGERAIEGALTVEGVLVAQDGARGDSGEGAADAEAAHTVGAGGDGSERRRPRRRRRRG